jgi:transcriptional regulator with XRE-family HTH domain
MKKTPNPIDKYVGARLRTRRVLLGMSQEKLGDALGVTFQQIQKYEKGVNRISASRLKQIAQTLDAPIGFFYEGGPTETAGLKGFSEPAAGDFVIEFLSTAEGVQLNRSFIRIRDPRVRRRLVELVASLAEAQSERGPGDEELS